MTELVLADTSAWITFFQKRNNLAQTLQGLILDNRVVRCGMVELELKQGFRKDEARLLALVMGFKSLDTNAADFSAAGDALGGLRRSGFTIPPSDGLIAAVAVRHGVELLTDDKHFKHYPGLKLFEP